tara:strand:+ start:39 stop:218 length:180 start_codon:yes stop_codon:yes gene_type:complete
MEEIVINNKNKEVSITRKNKEKSNLNNKQIQNLWNLFDSESTNNQKNLNVYIGQMNVLT